MTPYAPYRLLILTLCAQGCSFDYSTLQGFPDGGLGGDAGFVLSDSAPSDGGSVSPDVFVLEEDVFVEGTDAHVPDAPPSSMDPRLSVPTEGSFCDTPGQACILGTEAFACRIADATHSRCEDFTTPSGLGTPGSMNTPCSSGLDCDSPFACFQGMCLNYCRLGRTDCGAAGCADVGHETYGVCNPPL